MRKIVQEYIKKPDPKLYAQLTTMEQKYVARVAKPKADAAPKKKKITGIG